LFSILNTSSSKMMRALRNQRFLKLQNSKNF